LLGLNVYHERHDKKLLQVATLEGLENPLVMDGRSAFCEVNKGYDLEIKCNKLNRNNCGDTSCCVWTSSDKCVAGNERGPTFNSDSNGKTFHVDHYYHKNKCYGDGC